MTPRVEPASSGDTFVYVTIENFTESVTADQARELARDLIDAADTVDPDALGDQYSIAWGSGAQGDVDDPAPARGARRCDECDEWTDEYADECSRCGGDPYADSRDDC